MKYRRIIAAALAAFTLFTGATVIAAGTASDPLVSRSWLEDIFETPMEKYVETAFDTVKASLQAKTEGLQAAADTYARQRVATVYAEELAEAVLEKVEELRAQEETTLTAGMTRRTLKKGDVVTGPPGASVMFVTGTGKVVGPAGSEILNVTAGSTRQPGPAIREGILYMMLADNGSGIEVTSATATVLLKDGARGGYELQYEAYADALNLLGLFRGTDSGYELERAPSRIEALIMLIRLLGEDADAMENDTVSPFRDLSDWEAGKRYVAYAYRMCYTNGTGDTTFGPNQNSALEQYLTFVLRALGYRDGVDFQWDTTCRDLALDIGLLEDGELESIARDGFRRDHVVAISYRALDCELQDGSGTLADRLVDMDVVSRAQLRHAAQLVN
ncbi:MAG: S-layer homology domain-containing protein [Clostridia bacterium]|nr:S-layer homology domain-containing protein [Clostridia bacterium]